jgi:iron-sulfur cluster insertion protein
VTEAAVQQVSTSEAMESDSSVLFTQSAAEKVFSLLQEEDDPAQMLRVFVTGGGCSGFQYGFRFEKQADDDDTRVSRAGVTLLVDPMSLQYLQGAEIDYKESVEGAQFVIRNPNASTTCGCGNSFTV